jgi:hypothetical protein
MVRLNRMSRPTNAPIRSDRFTADSTARSNAPPSQPLPAPSLPPSKNPSLPDSRQSNNAHPRRARGCFEKVGSAPSVPLRPPKGSPAAFSGSECASESVLASPNQGTGHGCKDGVEIASPPSTSLEDFSQANHQQTNDGTCGSVARTGGATLASCWPVPVGTNSGPVECGRTELD